MKTEIKISGMSCAHCVASVKSALEALDGVSSAEVSLDKACAAVEYNDAVVSLEDMKTAMEEIGFDAE